METLIIAIAALVASCLTLFSGFGLGTLLMPVVALFFPVDLAIGITAIVHFANNLFKLGLLGMRADRTVVIKFGVPGVLSAVVGAFLLAWLADLQPLAEYSLFGRQFQVMPVKLIIGLLILVMVALESSPAFAAIALDRKLLPLGGCVSGFFGGLSGHQGAFRSMFLIKAGLNKEQFVATGVVVAVMIDFTRLLIYGRGAVESSKGVDWSLVAVATVSAFAGAWIGNRLLRSVTIRAIHAIVSVLLAMVGLGLVAGAL